MVLWVVVLHSMVIGY